MEALKNVCKMLDNSESSQKFTCAIIQNALWQAEQNNKLLAKTMKNTSLIYNIQNYHAIMRKEKFNPK